MDVLHEFVISLIPELKEKFATIIFDEFKTKCFELVVSLLRWIQIGEYSVTSGVTNTSMPQHTNIHQKNSNVMFQNFLGLQKLLNNEKFYDVT
jgi:hypothetical protein